jgi:diketogulonate reductase-like aldo/keto reductase
VSNYTIRHLEELLAASPIPPAVNQVEFSPFLYQEELLDYCRRHGIQLEAYSPLTKGRRLGDPTLAEVARKHHRTPSQVLIRWALQHGLVVIPKSQRLEHIRENFSVFDFSLSPADMAQLDGLSEDYRTSWDPSDVQ